MMSVLSEIYRKGMKHLTWKQWTDFFRIPFRYLRDDKYRFFVHRSLGIYDNIPDEEFLRKEFRLMMGYNLDIDHPVTFNEKLQWLKIHDRRPEYIKMVDKYAVKGLVAKIIGTQYVIPTLGIWEQFDDIEFSKLPNRFVLKCTHDSQSVILVDNKEELDLKKTRYKLESCLRRNMYYNNREWSYKDVPPRIIAEPYLKNNSGTELMDYKFMCFDGKVKCSFVCSDRFSGDGLKVTFFDINWREMPFERNHPRSKIPIPKPINYEEMVILAEKLAKGIPFVRADFYENNGKTYFGELTFFPGAGFEAFTPPEWDKILGEWIHLPEVVS